MHRDLREVSVVGLKVGDLRRALAHETADDPVVIIVKDEYGDYIQSRAIKILEAYPDTTNSGEFKIVVSLT